MPHDISHIQQPAIRESLMIKRLMMSKIAIHPKNPERVCWGCDKYCPADHLDCGNGTVRTQHPIEIFGEDWLDWSKPVSACQVVPAQEVTSHNAK